MERIEYRGVVDKSNWQRGPWDDEQDKVQWMDDATELPCLIVRGPSGALCGYVGVAPDHPLHGIGYQTPDIDVHGGLSFAGACQEGPESEGICHKPAPGESDSVWWLGFHCARSSDRTPGFEPGLWGRLSGEDYQYRDM